MPRTRDRPVTCDNVIARIAIDRVIAQTTRKSIGARRTSVHTVTLRGRIGTAVRTHYIFPKFETFFGAGPVKQITSRKFRLALGLVGIMSFPRSIRVSSC